MSTAVNTKHRGSYKWTLRNNCQVVEEPWFAASGGSGVVRYTYPTEDGIVLTITAKVNGDQEPEEVISAIQEAMQNAGFVLEGQDGS